MHISAATWKRWCLTMLLEAEDLDLRFGHVHALSAVSIAVGSGKIVAVLGSNGAGKSSLLKAVLGFAPIIRGRIRFDGADITRWSPARRIRLGLALVPEGRRILIGMSVEDNLLMGAYARVGATPRAEIDRVYDRFPNLAARRHMPAAVLSGGEQQMLAIGRALMSRPKVMMLDEPSLGLSPRLVDELFRLVAQLNHEGLSILMVEQNTRKALQVADYVYVLELGRVVHSGKPDDLSRDPVLQRAYLGVASPRTTADA
jgi:branched-chain amino acid transport system ATP-binding protein